MRGKLQSVLEKTANLVAMRHGIKVVFGKGAYTDRGGKRITLPSEFLQVGIDDDEAAIVTGFLDHEVSHVVYSDFSVLETLKGLPDMGKLHKIQNAIEDLRIEKLYVKEWRGAAASLELCHNRALDMAIESGRLAQTTPVHKLAVAIVVKFNPRTKKDHGIFEAMPKEIWDLLDKVVTQEEIESVTSSADCIELAKKILARVKELVPPDPSEQGDNSEGGEPQNGDSQHPEGEGNSGKGDSDSNKESETGSPEPQEPGEEDSGSADEEDGEGASPDEGAEDDTALDDEEDDGGADSGSGEGDAGEGDPVAQLAKDMNQQEDEEAGDEPGCSMDDLMEDMVKSLVEQMKERETSQDYYTIRTTEDDKYEPVSMEDASRERYLELIKPVKERVPALSARLKAALVAQNRVRWETGKKRGRLNRRAFPAFVVSNDDRLFREKVEDESLRSTVVGIMIDHSASMDDTRQRGYPFNPKSKIAVALGATAAVSEILDLVRIKFGIWGFTTGHPRDAKAHYNRWSQGNPGADPPYIRWGPLKIRTYKDFAEDYRLVKSRLGADPVLGHDMMNSYEGESLRYAAIQLANRPEKRKILILMTDGEPVVEVTELNEHGLWYLREVINSVKTAGIELITFGIGFRPTSDYPKPIAIGSIDDLPEALMGQFRSLLLQNLGR